MSLESKEVWWVECDGDGCGETLGDDSFDDFDEQELLDAAKEDGWHQRGNDWFCETCAVRKALVELTPIQQAAVMHGKEPFLAFPHGGFKR